MGWLIPRRGLTLFYRHQKVLDSQNFVILITKSGSWGRDHVTGQDRNVTQSARLRPRLREVQALSDSECQGSTWANLPTSSWQLGTWECSQSGRHSGSRLPLAGERAAFDSDGLSDYLSPSPTVRLSQSTSPAGGLTCQLQVDKWEPENVPSPGATAAAADRDCCRAGERFTAFDSDGPPSSLRDYLSLSSTARVPGRPVG